MIYYTGDIHGMPWNIISFCKKVKTTKDDTIVILGDVGANYYGDSRDTECKRQLSKVNPTVLCIHGNHEIRPTVLFGIPLDGTPICRTLLFNSFLTT